MDPLEIIINFLKQTDELDTAKTLLDTFKKYSTSLEQYDQLGRLYNDVKAYPEAIDCASKTLVMSSNTQQMYASRSNLAKMYNHTNAPDKALQYINVNLAINENDYEAKMEKLFSLYLLGRLEESSAMVEELYNDPDCPKQVKDRCQFNLGSYQMDRGEFKEGIRNFIDVGHQIGIWNNSSLPGNTWDGQVIENATIAILAEGGIGDEIINVRFMRHIENLGMKAIWVTARNEVADLFNRNGFTSVVGKENVFGDDIRWCYSFYLPILLNLDKEDLDIGVYLQPDQKYIDKWKEILPSGTKVALRWSGNSRYEQDLHRSLSLSAFMNAFGDSGVQFVSVQRDGALEELDAWPDVFDAGKYSDTLEDLLACLSLCDQIITSCTSVAHIAAASGCNVTVLPPIACYYVWLGSGNDWYGKHVTVIRQKAWKDWSHVNQVKLISDYCSRCGNKWIEHDFGVPEPSCP